MLAVYVGHDFLPAMEGSTSAMWPLWQMRKSINKYFMKNGRMKHCSSHQRRERSDGRNMDGRGVSDGDEGDKEQNIEMD